MSTKRHTGLDALRIIAAFLVVMIHMSGSFRELAAAGTITLTYPLSFLMTMADSGVSCFFFLSGAFMIADDRNASFRRFYSRTAKKFVIPTLIFSVYYLVYALVPPMIRGDGVGVSHALKEAIMGRPFYHLWYMYAMICISLFIPAIVRLRLMTGEKVFERIALLIFVSSTVSDLTSSHMIQYDPGSAYRYAGLLFIGYVVKRRIDMKEEHYGINAFVSFLGFAASVTTAAFLSLSGKADLAVYLLGVAAPVCLFAAFACLRDFPDCSRLAGYTFLIYLIHAGVRDVISRVCDKLLGKDAILLITEPWVNLIAVTLLFFLISLVLALIYGRLSAACEKRFRLRGRIYDGIKALFVVFFGV